MELASLFLLVLLPPADATGDTATAVAASLQRELGDVSMAIAPDTMVTPAMWQGEKSQMRARFVAHVVWKGKDTATIELSSPTSAKDKPGFHSERKLSFSPQDSKTERGRAMGLVMAELLRESPASALVPAQPEVGAAAAPSHVALGGMFAFGRVRTGNWAMGPEVTYDFGIGHALRLQASGTALYGSADQYSGLGADVGAFWDLLVSDRGQHALGIGFALGVMRESATGTGDNAQGASTWNLAVGPSLGGRVTLWRTVRLVGETDLRATSGTMSITNKVERNGTETTTTHTFSRWRPVFALGLEVAL